MLTNSIDKLKTDLQNQAKTNKPKSKQAVSDYCESGRRAPLMLKIFKNDSYLHWILFSLHENPFRTLIHCGFRYMGSKSLNLRKQAGVIFNNLFL